MMMALPLVCRIILVRFLGMLIGLGSGVFFLLQPAAADVRFFIGANAGPSCCFLRETACFLLRSSFP